MSGFHGYHGSFEGHSRTVWNSILGNTDVKSNEVRFQLDLKADYTECEEHYKRRERHRLKDGLEERIAQRKIKPSNFCCDHNINVAGL